MGTFERDDKGCGGMKCSQELLVSEVCRTACFDI
jgi:hypothetical protein